MRRAHSDSVVCFGGAPSGAPGLDASDQPGMPRVRPSARRHPKAHTQSSGMAEVCAAWACAWCPPRKRSACSGRRPSPLTFGTSLICLRPQRAGAAPGSCAAPARVEDRSGMAVVHPGSWGAALAAAEPDPCRARRTAGWAARGAADASMPTEPRPSAARAPRRARARSHTAAASTASASGAALMPYQNLPDFIASSPRTCGLAI